MNCAIHTDVPAAAYCRTCGKALCENCKRDVMGAIYCEPCIAARLQGAGPAVPRAVPVTIVEGAPSPALAGVLAALIPGLGAMYNGQFIKAFLHVVIFAMLIVAVSHSFGFAPLFGILIGFFWFYMIFDAVKSARAKQLGLPAPDPLGLDRLFGLEENQPPTPTPVPGQATVEGQRSPQPAVHDKTPTGAIVLIALGVFFLLGNLEMFHVRRLWPLFLIGFGLWIAYKRAIVERG